MQTRSNLLFDINCLWIGPNLRPLELVCLLSMLKHGHRVRLFTYAGLDNVPDGIEVCNAREILPEERIARHRRTGSMSITADVFRYALMRKSLGAWLDADVLLLKPLKRARTQMFGMQTSDFINNAVLYLPKESSVLESLCAFTDNLHPIPPWFPLWRRKFLSLRNCIGKPKHVSQMSWGVFGPQALTHFVFEHAQENFACPAHDFFPVPFEQAHGPFMTSYDTASRIRPDTRALHLWNHRLRKPSRLRPDNPAGKLVVEKNCFVADFAKRELGFQLHSEE